MRTIGYAPLLTPESWKAADEPDERDKELARVTDELRKHQRAHPDIKLAAYGRNLDVPAKSLLLTVKSFSQSPSDIDDLVDRVGRLNPIATNFQLEPPSLSLASPFARSGFLGSWEKPSSEQIRTYQEDKYPAWLQKVRETILAIPDHLIAASRKTLFCISIANEGYGNANDARLSITAFDGLLLGEMPSKEEIRASRKVTLSPAPTPPRGRFVYGALSAMERMMGGMGEVALPNISPASFLARKDRDPNAFYWVDGAPESPVDELELI